MRLSTRNGTSPVPWAPPWNSGSAVITDAASYSDIVFGLFAICGYRFSPRIAVISDARLWRTHAAADYGPLQPVSHHTIRLDRIRAQRGDMLCVVGSLTLGEVRGHDLIRGSGSWVPIVNAPLPPFRNDPSRTPRFRSPNGPRPLGTSVVKMWAFYDDGRTWQPLRAAATADAGRYRVAFTAPAKGSSGYPDAPVPVPLPATGASGPATAHPARWWAS
ncbi:Tn3 family transposase [Streptomyces sp. NPDC001508]|uniref:Tn3 family transposase n=1 Tax=Streptomyces sp. NPDC001508 TaxID=3154656 RepID=UPI0033325028